MVNGSAPDTLLGHRGPARRSRPWAGLAVVMAGIAAAAVVVPPLIAPDHHHRAAAPIQAPSVTPVRTPSAATVTPSAVTFTPSAAPAAFTPIAAEAESASSTLTGGAARTGCAACHGGGRVRYVCYSCRVTVRATVPVSGRRTLTIVYESDGPRSLKVSVNGGVPRTYPVTGPGWTSPRTFHFTADLPTGPLRVALYNDESSAPDIDAVLIS